MVQNPIGHSSPPKSDKYHYPPRFFLRGLCIIHDISKLYEIIRLAALGANACAVDVQGNHGRWIINAVAEKGPL